MNRNKKKGKQEQPGRGMSRRTFIKTSAVLLPYVAPAIETLLMDAASAEAEEIVTAQAAAAARAAVARDVAAAAAERAVAAERAAAAAESAAAAQAAALRISPVP